MIRYPVVCSDRSQWAFLLVHWCTQQNTTNFCSPGAYLPRIRIFGYCQGSTEALTHSPLAGWCDTEDAASRLASSVVPSLDLADRCCVIGVMFDSDGRCVPFAGRSNCSHAQRVGISCSVGQMHWAWCGIALTHRALVLSCMRTSARMPNDRIDV